MVPENIENEDCIALQFSHILRQVEDNMMYSFLYGIKQTKGGLIEGVKEILEHYGQPCRATREYVPSTPIRKKRNSADASKNLPEHQEYYLKGKESMKVSSFKNGSRLLSNKLHF